MKARAKKVKSKNQFVPVEVTIKLKTQEEVNTFQSICRSNVSVPRVANEFVGNINEKLGCNILGKICDSLRPFISY